MDIKKIWYFLPTVLLPFTVMATPIILFFNSGNPVTEFFMSTIFQNNPLFLFAALIPLGLLSAGLNILGIVKCLTNQWDALEMARYAMIVKLIFFPVYGIIFIITAVLSFALIFAFIAIIVLFPIPIIVLLCNILLLALSNLLTTAAVVNANRQGLYASKESVWIIVLQQIFYIDVIAAIVFYVRLKKRCITDK